MKGKKQADAFRRGNVECAWLILSDPRTVPGSLVCRWAMAVLAGNGGASTTAGPPFEQPNGESPKKSLCITGVGKRRS